MLLFEGEKGRLICDDENTSISVMSRRGLFAKDTTMVFDYLLENQSLYVQPSASLYATLVADAAKKSAETSQLVILPREGL